MNNEGVGTTTKLHLSKDLNLPAEETAESAIGLIAKRGRGKSGVLKVMMEEMAAAGVPFVMFDPVGIAWGLRSSFDGKASSGIKVLVVGGPHADVRLERRAGAAVAQAVVQANVSAIIDFSEEPKSVYREFVKDFSLEIFKINDGPRMIILEEAPELVPQRLRPDMAATFDAVERLVSRGRNKGLGVILVSQRSATINKDVLTQVDVMIVMGLTSPQDRAALKEWVEAKAEKDKLKEFDEGLAGLQRQEGWVWSPEAFGGIFRKVRFRDFKTFHPDKTHLRRQGLLQVKPVTTDVTEIVAKLGATVAKIAKEKTEAVDASRAQTRVKELERQVEQLKARPAPAAPTPKAPPKPVEVNVLSKGEARSVKSLVHDLVSASKPLGELGRQLTELNGALLAKAGELSRALDRARIAGAPAAAPHVGIKSRPLVQLVTPDRLIPLERPPRPEQRAPAVSIHTDQTPADGEVALLAGERRMLQAVAQRHPLKVTRSQIGTLAGFTPSGGTFGNYFGRLRKFGFLQENGGGQVVITQAGLDYLGADIPPAPSSTAELIDMWRNRLLAGERKMLDELVAVYPEALSRDELGERSGFTASGGTFGNYLGTLRRNELIVVEGGQVRASETLFIDA